MYYSVFASTDIGNTKSINQDSFYIRYITSNKKPIIFGIICDGIGGLSHGEFASAYVVQRFIKWFERYINQQHPFQIDFREINITWADIIHDCNEKMIKFGERRNIQIGTTMNAILIKKDRYMVANIGDSRTYSIIKKAKKITTDHTFYEQLQEQRCQILKKKINVDYGNVLTKCIGVYPSIVADYYTGKIKNGQVIICCTDGYYRKLNGKEIEKLFHNNPIEKAISLSIESVKSLGETDNITVFAIKREKK